jgi:hypothetical protein
MEVGHYGTPAAAIRVTIVADHAYVAAGIAGLRIININDPDSLTEIGYCVTPGSVQDVAVSGNHAYVACWDAGLRVIDISNPDSLTEVGHYDTPGGARAVAISGNFAYVADASSGLRIIDISIPTTPVEVGFYDTPGISYGVTVSGYYAFIADNDYGLRIYQGYGPAGVTADPIRQETNAVQSVKLRILGNNVEYQLPAAGRVRLTVYNIAGQRVRTVVDGPAGRGVHRATWDRRSDDGRPVSSGSYLVNLATDSGTATARMLVVE